MQAIKKQNMKCCKNCRLCAELISPYERSDGACVYGYCFSGGDKNYSPNMGKGLPIFVPLDCGAACKDFRKRPEEGEENEHGA